MTGDVGMAGVAIDSIEDMKVELHHQRNNVHTVVPVMNGHPRDQAKVSVHCRWPLVTGTDGQAGDAKYNTPCNTT